MGIVNKIVSVFTWPVTILLSLFLYLYFRRSEKKDWQEDSTKDVPEFPDFSSSEDNQSSVVSVCIGTCGRPRMLERLIRSVAEQEFKKTEKPKVNIVVVDNHSEKSAEDICQQLSRELDYPLHYCHEETPGIPFVRNRAVSESNPASDYIVFIDDDQYAEKQWLDELIHVQKQTEAEIVTGPVIADTTVDPPGWLKNNLLAFQRKRHPDMSRINYARTGNVLIKADLFTNKNLYFDPRYDLNGGDDYDFFQRALKKGNKIYWADNAITYEEIPEDRLTLRWQLQRSFRSGNGHRLHKIFNYQNFRKVRFEDLKRLNNGVVRIVTFMIQPNSFVHLLKYFSVALGRFSAGCGFRYDEYVSRH